MTTSAGMFIELAIISLSFFPLMTFLLLDTQVLMFPGLWFSIIFSLLCFFLHECLICFPYDWSVYETVHIIGLSLLYRSVKYIFQFRR